MSRSPLGWLNVLSPKDKFSRSVARNVAFGKHRRQSLDVYAPRDFAEPLPVLLFVYGGGWDSGQKEDYEFAGRAYAAAGYLCVIADYRVVPDAHFPDFLEDGAAALNWILAHAAAFGGDAERIVTIGHSAGAYNAVMLGLAATRFGARNLGGRIKGVVGLSGPYDFYPFEVPASIAAFSREPEPELTQPVNLVTHDAPPMFLGHGSRDLICGPYNTANLAARLRANHVHVVERVYPGLNHPATLLTLLPMLRWRAPVYRETLAFVRSVTLR